MKNSKELKEYIGKMFAKDKNVPMKIGNGILVQNKCGFSEEQLELHKKEIASMLGEIGIHKHILVSLRTLTMLEDGTVWNPLLTLEDFQSLELLLAVSHAYGFLENNEVVMQMNANQLGENSCFMSTAGRSYCVNDEEWLREIREKVIDNMFFITDPVSIEKAMSSEEKTEENAKQYVKKHE